MNKTCTKCKEMKNLSEFGKKTSSRDGLQFQCRVCIKEWNGRYYDSNCEKVKKTVRRYAKNNRENVLKSKRITSSRMSEKQKDRKREMGRRWNRNNKPLKNYYTARRRKINKQATPDWVDREVIQSYYQMAKGYECQGLGKFHVDHIIPLSNKNICGLNVPANLQIIRAEDNRTKSNQFDGTYSNDSWK